MSLLTGLRRYLRGAILFPYYATRTYELVNSLAGSHQHNKPTHESIFETCESLGATYTEKRLHFPNITVALDPPRVIETINEVLVRRDYDFAINLDSYVMLDVGMNVGIAALRHACEPNCAHVYGYEPLTPTYNRALRNIGLNPNLAGKVSTYNYGLSDADARLSVKYSLNDIMSASSEGTFDACFAGEVSVEGIDVRCAARELATVLANHRTDSVFLKLDCEGAEFRIIPNIAATGLLDRVSVLICEWHATDPGPLLSILKHHGFSCFLQQLDVKWNVGLIKAVKPR